MFFFRTILEVLLDTLQNMTFHRQIQLTAFIFLAFFSRSAIPFLLVEITENYWEVCNFCVVLLSDC